MVLLAPHLRPLALMFGVAGGARLAKKTEAQARAPADARRAPPPMLEGALENTESWEEHKIYPASNITWEGWGVAMAWWANLFGDDEALADLVWTTQEGINLGPKPELQNLPGLGLNIARYNVGGSVGAERDGGAGSPPGRIGDITMDISNIKDYKRIQGFWLNWYDPDPDSDSWNWKTDEKQINMLKWAQDRGANLFELFSNSPMWWMTKSKNPAGTQEDGGENLQDWNIPDLAYYLAQVAKRFKDQHNIHFHSISPYNEPRGNRWGCWWNSGAGNTAQEGNCMYMQQQRQVVSALHEELNKAGLGDVLIAASEENTFDMAQRSWNDMGAELSMVKQINVHGYQGLVGDRVTLGRKAAAEGKVLWMSEYCDGGSWPDGGTSNGMLMANSIHFDFEYLKMSSWSYWQIVDETWGWGLFKFANNAEEGWWGENKEHWHVEPKYWVLLHFSRHIRQGMLILSHNSFSQNGAYTIAAYSPSERKLVLVTTNFGGERWVNYDLSSLARVAGTGSVWATNTDGSRRYELEPGAGTWTIPADKKFGSQFAAWSLKSFEILDVDL